MSRAALCILFFTQAAALAQPLEKPIAILLRGDGAEYVRLGDRSYLHMSPGELLFAGDLFRTGADSVTILHCSTRLVIDVPARVSGEARKEGLVLQPAIARRTRSVPECEMPLAVRRKPANESHIGETAFGSRLLTPIDTNNPAASTEPGIARLLKQLAVSERTGDRAEALTLTKALFNLWPEAAWLRVKLFQNGRAVAARQQQPVVSPGTSAVVIGISRYKDPTISPLRWAAADAQLIFGYLRSRGVPEGQIALLLNERATAAAIRAAFDRILVRRTATVFIFIAAHGSESYIVNYDFDRQDPRDKGIPLTEINELISAELSGVKTMYVYVDSCKSGYLQGLRAIELEPPKGGRLLGFAASRTNESSYEYDGLGGDHAGHGVFTWFLNQALTATGKQAAEVSTVRGAVRYVHDHVVDYVEKRGEEQHPVDFGNYQDRALIADFSLPASGNHTVVTASAAAIPVGLRAGTGEGSSRDLRLEYENAGEAVVSRYLAGEADPLKKEDFETAATSFDEAGRIAPESVWLESRSAFAHGRALIFDKQYGQAIRLLDRAIQLDPAGAIAYNALGIAYLETPDYPRALAAFEDAIGRAPLWAYAWHNKALAENQMGNYRGAIESYRRAVAIAPREPQYYYLTYNLGAIYQSLNRLREAEAQYRKAGAMTPSHGEPENAIGTIRAIQGKKSEARRWFELALRKDPNLEIARRNLAALQ